MVLPACIAPSMSAVIPINSVSISPGSTRRVFVKPKKGLLPAHVLRKPLQSQEQARE